MFRDRQIEAFLACLVAFAILAGGKYGQAGYVSDWEASSGLLPGQISPAYSVSSDGNAMQSLSGGVLTISTVANSDLFLNVQNAPVVDTSSSFYIQASMRLVSGQSSNAARAPAEIFFTTGNGVGNFLWISQGKVFFDTGQLVAGPSVSVDTSVFHTYRIEDDGSGNLDLLIDGSSVLTGHTYSSLSDFGSTEQISFGDNTLLASGVSQWQSFTHDALTSPQTVAEPSSLLMLGLGVVGLARKLRR